MITCDYCLAPPVWHVFGHGPPRTDVAACQTHVDLARHQVEQRAGIPTVVELHPPNRVNGRVGAL